MSYGIMASPELQVREWSRTVHHWNTSRNWVAKQKSWKLLCSDKAALTIESLICYDRQRQLLIAHRGPYKEAIPRTWHMSLKEGVPGWEQVLEAADLPNGHDARSLMYFDPVGKVALLYERKEKRIWSYDPDKKQWSKLSPRGPEPPFETTERVIAYMDRERNVFVVIGYGRVWCYRHTQSP